MREPARPEVFPDHLRSLLLPVPETSYEALFLLGLFPEESREASRNGDMGLHGRIVGVERPSPVDTDPLRADRFPLFGG